MTLCLRRGFSSQGGFVSNELSQVPVHAGEDLCHQIQHYYTLNKAIPYIFCENPMDANKRENAKQTHKSS